MRTDILSWSQSPIDCLSCRHTLAPLFRFCASKFPARLFRVRYSKWEPFKQSPDFSVCVSQSPFRFWCGSLFLQVFAGRKNESFIVWVHKVQDVIRIPFFFSEVRIFPTQKCIIRLTFTVHTFNSNFEAVAEIQIVGAYKLLYKKEPWIAFRKLFSSGYFCSSICGCTSELGGLDWNAPES